MKEIRISQNLYYESHLKMVDKFKVDKMEKDILKKAAITHHLLGTINNPGVLNKFNIGNSDNVSMFPILTEHKIRETFKSLKIIKKFHKKIKAYEDPTNKIAQGPFMV